MTPVGTLVMRPVGTWRGDPLELEEETCWDLEMSPVRADLLGPEITPGS